MSYRAYRPLAFTLLAGALALTGCALPANQAEPATSETPNPLDTFFEDAKAEYPPMDFGQDPAFPEGTSFEFVPDFRASQGWLEVTVVPQLPGGEPSSSGSYALDDESCTISWSITTTTAGDDKTESDALLDSLARPDSERHERRLSAQHPDGTTAGTLEVVGALSADNLSYIWARVMGEARISIESRCDTREASLTSYDVVNESLPFVFTRPDELQG